MIIRNAKVILVVILLTMTFALKAYCGMLLDFGKPIECIVVDESTEEPVEGVYVIALWRKVKISVGGDIDDGVIEVQEAITNKKGCVKIKGWRRISSIVPHKVRTEITVFKPAYKTGKLFDFKSSPGQKRVTVKIQKHQGSFEERSDNFYSIKRNVINSLEKSQYSKIPYTMKILEKIEKEISEEFEKRREVKEVKRKKVY